MAWSHAIGGFGRWHFDCLGPIRRTGGQSGQTLNARTLLKAESFHHWPGRLDLSCWEEHYCCLLVPSLSLSRFFRLGRAVRARPHTSGPSGPSSDLVKKQDRTSHQGQTSRTGIAGSCIVRMGGDFLRLLFVLCTRSRALSIRLRVVFSAVCISFARCLLPIVRPLIFHRKILWDPSVLLSFSFSR